MLAMATMLFATGCSDEENIMESNKQNVTFTVALEDAGTGSRAIAEGVTIGKGYYVDELHYAVYEVNKSDLLMEGSAERKTDGTFSVTIPLVNQLDFEIAFFAHDKDASAFEVPTTGDLRNLEFKTSLLANQETYDAFSTVITHRANAQTTNKVELKRILAQLNVAGESDDIANARKLGANATHSKIKLTGVYTKFDARTGIASDPAEVVYDVAPILKKYDAITEPKNELLTVGTDNYYYLAMAYALVNTESDLFNSELTFYRAHESNAEVAGNAVSVRTIPNLPLQRNYRTNVTGSILTQDENFSITLDTDFGVEDHNVESDDIALVKDLDITEVAQLNNALKELLKVEKEVILNVKGLKDYTKTGGINIVIPENTTEFPVNATGITLNLLDLNKGFKVTGTEFADTVVVATDLNTNIDEAEIIIPNSHVKVIGNITTLTISSSSTTLEVAEGSSIGTVIVRTGNVTIMNGGEVNNIIKEEGNNETTVVAVEPGGTLGTIGEGIIETPSADAKANEWKLTKDTEIEKPFVVPGDYTIDLNGYTLSYTSDEQGEAMITNNHELVIKDSSEEKKGKMIFTYAGEADSNYGKGNYTIVNSGELTIEGGTIEIDAKDHVGKFPHALYVIQTANRGSVIIKDGIIKNDHNIALRQFGASSVTVNDGEIEGLRAIWMQAPGSNANDAPEMNLTVTGGTLTGTAIDGTADSGNKLAIYSYGYGNDMKNVKINISGGTFNGDVALTGGKNKNTIETVNITGGTFNGLWGDVYSYGDDELAAETITITGGQFSSIAPMVYMNSEEEVITLNKNIEIEDESYLFKGQGTLNLNGKTIKAINTISDKNEDGKLTSADNVVLIDVRGDLTVKDGTITLRHNGDNYGWNACTEVFYVGFNGTLNVDNATIENLGGSDMAYAIDLVNADGKGKGITLNVNNSTIKSSYIPVRVFNNGAGMNDVDITNSTLEGTSRAFWVHIYSDKDNGGKGIKGKTLDINIYNPDCKNTFIANDPNRIIEYGFDDVVNYDANGNLLLKDFDNNDNCLVSNSEALVAALEAGHSVLLTTDIKIDPANMSNAYGTTGINVKNGQSIDGGGYTLDIKGAGGTWDSGINTTGGLIENIKVTGSFRGIFINHNSTYSKTVVLKNVIIDGTTYTISCDQGLNQNFEAYNSTFNGWTSYAATIGTAKFTGCNFGEGNGYSFCRPYAPTEFIGCNFESGFKMDCVAACTFENCKLDGVAITAENIATLVTSNTANATVK